MASTDSPRARRRSTVCSMSSVMAGGRPPWFPLRAAAFRPSRVASRMFSRSFRPSRRRTRTVSGRCRTGRRYRAVARPALQGDALCGEVVRERGQFGGVVAEPLHLVRGEDHTAVWGVRLDLPARVQGLLELGTHAHTGGHLLREDLVARNAGCCQGMIKVNLTMPSPGQPGTPQLRQPNVPSERSLNGSAAPSESRANSSRKASVAAPHLIRGPPTVVDFGTLRCSPCAGQLR